MAESGTLLRCYTGNGIEGSNPSLSARKCPLLRAFFLFQLDVRNKESIGNNGATLEKRQGKSIKYFLFLYP